MKKNKGFTLAEMLIVVAIIGVLVAITVVTITNSLEKAREATDLANIRNAYGELVEVAECGGDLKSYIVKFNSGADTCYCIYIKSAQKIAGWQSSNFEVTDKGYLKLNEAYVTAPYNAKGEFKDMYQLKYYVTKRTDTDDANPDPYNFRIVIISESAAATRPIYNKAK